MSTLKVDRKSNEKPLGEQSVIAYWVARRVSDKCIGNMRKDKLVCTVIVDAAGEPATHKISIPIMQNKKPLQVGEELLLYEDPQPTTTTAPPQTLPPARKRQAVPKKYRPPRSEQRSERPLGRVE